MNSNKNYIDLKTRQKGQALVMLLVFIAVAVIIVSAPVVLMVVANTSATRFDRGQITLDAAESGVENALMSLLRNPNYAGETMPIGEANVVITVPSGNFPKTFTSKAVVNQTVRTVQVKVGYSNNILSVIFWKEIY